MTAATVAVPWTLAAVLAVILAPQIAATLNRVRKLPFVPVQAEYLPSDLVPTVPNAYQESVILVRLFHVEGLIPVLLNECLKTEFKKKL